MRNGVNTNAEYGNVSSWPLDFMGGNRDAELVTGREGSIKGISALCSRRGTTENKIVNVVPDEPHHPPPNDPFESIGDGRKDFGGGAQAERKHCVDVDGVLPLNAQEEAVLWVDRDNADSMSIFAIRLPWPSLAASAAISSTVMYLREHRSGSMPSFTL